MIDFIGMGLLDLVRGAQTKNYKMKYSCPQWDSTPGPSAYDAKPLNVALLDEISIEHLNINRILPESSIIIYLYSVPRVRCSKMF